MLESTRTLTNLRKILPFFGKKGHGIPLIFHGKVMEKSRNLISQKGHEPCYMHLCYFWHLYRHKNHLGINNVENSRATFLYNFVKFKHLLFGRYSEIIQNDHITKNNLVNDKQNLWRDNYHLWNHQWNYTELGNVDLEI